MTKITKFNKENLPEIRAKINEALKTVQDLGVECEIGNINFTCDKFTTKLTVKLPNAVPDYERNLNRQWYYKKGMELNIDGERVIVAGWLTRGKYKLVVNTLDEDLVKTLPHEPKTGQAWERWGEENNDDNDGVLTLHGSL